MKKKKNHELRIHFMGIDGSPTLCRSRQGLYAVLSKTDRLDGVTCVRCLDFIEKDKARLKGIQQRGTTGDGNNKIWKAE